METRLCKIIRNVRELRQATTMFEAAGENLHGIPEGYVEVLEEALRLASVPERQRELFWILTCPEKC